MFRLPLSSHDANRSKSISPISTETLASILCICLCGLGAMWLIPWVTILPIARGSSLIPGLVIVGLLVIAALYAVRDPRDKQQGD
jgi:hypothetical protein